MRTLTPVPSTLAKFWQYTLIQAKANEIRKIRLPLVDGNGKHAVTVYALTLVHTDYGWHLHLRPIFGCLISNRHLSRTNQRIRSAYWRFFFR